MAKVCKHPRTHLGRYRVTVIILSLSVTLWKVLPILSQYWPSSSGRFLDTRPSRKNNDCIYLVKAHFYHSLAFLFFFFKINGDTDKEKKEEETMF